MHIFIRLTLCVLTFVLSFVIASGFALPGNAQTLYSCESPRRGPNPILHTIDPDTGATTSTTVITLAGQSIEGCNGLARDPSTGVCWIALSTPDSGGDGSGGNGNRLLATINELTGVVTPVGNTGERIAGIAFNGNGNILYGITGDGDAAFPPRLVTLSKTNGSSTFIQNLPNVDEPGEAIGFNREDGLLYRLSGDFPVVDPNNIFQSINPNNLNITPIPLSGSLATMEEQLAMVHQSGNVFLTSQRDTMAIPSALHSITTDGVVNFIGLMDHDAKGLAFDCGVTPVVAQVPALRETGLIGLAILLGAAGLLVARYRRIPLIDS